MGLLYPFPVDEEREKDFVDIEFTNNKIEKITLSSYGLPYIFWLYLILILTTIGILFLAIRPALNKLFLTGDSLNMLISMSCWVILILIPLILLCFFFYQKKLIKQDKQLSIIHILFGLRLITKTIKLDNTKDYFEINHFIDSPNVARIDDEKAYKLFQNKGYFELAVSDINNKRWIIDRHSRKIDLEKIKTLLQKV